MTVIDDAVAQDVRTYAAQVRAALADLGADQVDDLTDGLEANLADALADERRPHRASLVDEFGSPHAYAAELRAAAGLEHAGTGRRTAGDVLRAPGRRLRAAADALLARLRIHAWWAPVEQFAVSLRPAWWLVRAWAVYQLVVRVLDTRPTWLPQHGAAWLLLLLAVVTSVQAGRGLWFTSRPAVAAVRAATVVAAVALLPLVLWHNGQDAWARSAVAALAYQHGSTSYRVEVPQDGVVVDGMPVSNLFVYDAEGNPLSDVQIYDDRGRQVRTTFDEGTEPWFRPDDDRPWYFAPAVAQDGRQRWNVYPLRGWPEQEYVSPDSGVYGPPEGVAPTTPPFPFAKAPTLEVPAGSTAAPGDGTEPAGGADGAADGTSPAPGGGDGTADASVDGVEPAGAVTDRGDDPATRTAVSTTVARRTGR
ncbi:HAAS signaling domain-containing protein [Cellulomonas iranensis]|uniref:Uncharacterized protein n=1 Tax=Cellulomonas iranensis TaxID=76862 RepID=A0ABU0GHR1_9CELL|nr:hypothetical protein [Cellulomonas iranensis]MDQ0424449.1 hypothetical protein [Cellulomonas iranensis]